MKHATLSELTEDARGLIERAKSDQFIIMDKGRPIGVVVGFESEEDWEDYFFEHDPIFLAKIAKSRTDYKAGRYVTLEECMSKFAEEERKPTATPRLKRKSASRR